MDLREQVEIEYLAGEGSDLMTAASRTKMPRKPKSSEDEKPRETMPVKIDKDLHRKAKLLAVHEGRELFEVIDEILRPVIETRYGKVVRDKQ